MNRRRKKNKPGQGRKPEGRVIGTIGMLPEVWARLDKIRGRDSRGKVIEQLIPK
jgi:hypothetical protein